MELLFLLAASAVLLLAAFVRLVQDLKNVPRPPVDDLTPPLPRPRRWLLVLALVLVTLTMLAATLGVLSDLGLGPFANHGPYRLTTLVCTAAYVAVVAFAFGLRTLALPAVGRSHATDAAMWLCFGLTTAIGSCYGLMLGRW